MLNAAVSFGQNASNSTSNISSHDPTLISGHFEINKENREKGIIEHINVNYALSPVPFTSVLNLEINTAEPTIFSACIYDGDGRILAKWQPTGKNHAYKGSLNISKLSPGDYNLSIYSEMDKGVAYTIPFQKKAKNN
jgi:hypothetical protein